MIGKSADISVLVTAHNEAHLAGPSLQSAERAIAAAEAGGLTVERLVGLDAPTFETAQFFAQPDIVRNWRVEHYDFRDPYVLRNRLVRQSSGKWLAWLDGDDLISENWLIAAVRFLQKRPADSLEIAHPELNWIFDEDANVFSLIDQLDPLYSKAYLYFNNYWDMMCICPRSFALRVPYQARKPDLGYGYEDWHWNLEVMRFGAVHRVIPDTVVAKRRWGRSVSRQNAEIRAVCRPSETLAINHYRTL